MAMLLCADDPEAGARLSLRKTENRAYIYPDGRCDASLLELVGLKAAPRPRAAGEHWPFWRAA